MPHAPGPSGHDPDEAGPYLLPRSRAARFGRQRRKLHPRAASDGCTPAVCLLVPRRADGMLARRYNASFTPRTNVLRDRMLMWAQPSPSGDELIPVSTIVEHVTRAAAGA